MEPLLQKLLTNAENRNHIIEFEIDNITKMNIVAPFNMRITRGIGLAFVEADTRTEAINIVINSGVPIKKFTNISECKNYSNIISTEPMNLFPSF